MVVGLCQWVSSSPFSCRWFGFAGWHWQPIMVHRVRVSAYSPSGREVLRAVAQWMAQGHTCGHRLADAACSWQSGARGARRMCLTCELSLFRVTNPHLRVRRSSAANWGVMAMREGAGVCAPVACWRRAIAATVGLGGRAWSIHDSSCNAPALVKALVWSFEGLEFGRKRLGCQNWSGVLRRNGRWLRQHFQELEGFHQQVIVGRFCD